MGPTDFSCYYQVYKDANATRKVLTQFRKHHPDNPIYMVSDGGLDFSDIAKEFNCTYQHSWLNIGYWSHMRSEVIEYRATNGAKGHTYGWNCEEAMVYLDRFYQACIIGNKPYIMLLADDVFVNASIEINNDFGITYGVLNRYDFKALENKLNWLDIPGKWCPKGWGMCCGNFINVDKFLFAYKHGRDRLLRNYMDIYRAGLENIGYMDSLISTLLWCSGYKLEEIINPHYSELDSNAVIFHKRHKERTY